MSSNPKQTDSRKTGHYVPSRYMQAAEKVSTQSNSSKEKSFFHKSRRDGQRLQVSGNVSQDLPSSSKFNSFEDCRRGMTSTPTSKGELPLPLLDASAVTGSDRYLTVPDLKEKIGPLSLDYTKGNFTKKCKSHTVTQKSQHSIFISHKERRKNDNFNEKNAEAEMDILYACYLQAAFLESEAKKTLETRSSRAVENLHKLFTLVLQHLYKLKSQKCSLKILSSLIEIHKHCQKQEDILKPVFEIIPILEEQYKSLSEAVNSAKHKLHVKDVILPNDDFEGNITDSLQKMSDFLDSFLKSSPNFHEIITSSLAMKNYADAGELITEALKRGLNLLEEARDLYFSESCLVLGYEQI